MAHSVGEQAARAVKNSEKKSAEALRTPAERLSAIRGSVAAKLYIVPDDIRFLLELLDATNASLVVAQGSAESYKNSLELTVVELQTAQQQIEQVRTVAPQLIPVGGVHPHEIDRFHDDGGAIHPEA